MQGPEPFLASFQIQLPCAVDSLATAVLDPHHRVLINHEVYFVSSESALERFRVAPFRFTGPVTDPVSLARFHPDVASPARTAGERLFYFESAETAARFDGDPSRYSTPKPTMRVVE